MGGYSGVSEADVWSPLGGVHIARDQGDKQTSTANPFSAGTVFIRENLTSVDSRFSRLKYK